MSENWDSPDDFSAQSTSIRQISASTFHGKSRFITRSSDYNGSYGQRNSNTNGRGGNRFRNRREQNGDAGGLDASWGDVDSNPVSNSGQFNNRRRIPFNPNEQPDDQIEVESNKAGRIIGRGGSKIIELQTESGARIFVMKEENENGMILVKLYGNEVETSKAKELIEDLIRDRINTRNNVVKNQNSDTERKPFNFNWKELSEECDRATKEMWSKCPPMIKNFYQESPKVKAFTKSQVERIREENNNISVSRVFAEKSGYAPILNPVQTFEQCFHNYPEILGEIEKMGFEKPSPIQCQAWPILLSGDDLIGIAQTGTGKTLAFLLPALIHIDGQPVPRSERNGPNVLIMAPTRELALQIEREVKKYQYRGIKAVCLYGGGNRREQVNVVTQGVQIIIATPGRLNDLVAAGHINVTSITYLVLDEADRMLDMGFEPQIRKVLLDIRPDRQTVMTSATWPPGVRRLAESYMNNPVQVYVGTLDLAAVHTVTQTILILEDSEQDKFSTFLNWVQEMDPSDKAIVFCGRKTRADYISTELASLGVDCQCIHGDREQVDREQALVDISNGRVQILIATDVASRGIDIQDITHVINYDFPRNVEEYVHRVGRTGRAGRTGESISYVTRADWANARELTRILAEADQYVPEELFSMAQRYEAWKEKKDQERGSGDGRGGRFGGRGGRGDRNNPRNFQW